MKKARERYFFVIVMPLNKNGQGPCDLKEAEKLTWEVWSQELDSKGSFDHLDDAIDECEKLNAAFGEI